MATITPNAQIAAGNNNAGGLARFDAIADANGVYFLMPKQLPFRVRGERRFRLNSTVARVGGNSTSLLFTAMTLAQYALMLSTYEGLVTVKLALTSTTYANYNATLFMPDENELAFIRSLVGVARRVGFTGPGYQDVRAELRNLEGI